MLICSGQFVMSQWSGSIFLWLSIKQILLHCRHINIWQLTGVLFWWICGGKRFILTKLLIIEQVVCTFKDCVLKVISCIYPWGPYKLYPTQCKQLPIPLSNTVHASLHRALRSLKPIDLTSFNDFGVIGMGLAVYRGSVLRLCTLWHSFFIYLLVYLCTGTPRARKV
jgi:hypothetical protein